jgi:hypothetical protein
VSAAILYLWATCLALHGGTPRVDRQGAIWMRQGRADTLLSWADEDVGDALRRAAEQAPRELWGVA